MDLVYATFSPWKSGSKKLPVSAVSPSIWQESGPASRAPFLEPIHLRRASNFYYGHCKKQAQTLTVRYAKLSPGLRITSSATFSYGRWQRYSASFGIARAIRPLSKSAARRPQLFSLGKMSMKFLELCRERIEASRIGSAGEPNPRTKLSFT